jgi:AcrR family transcriptional regulator|tara:strand:- start:433 stop:1014 length:582 start_codon:yes stop_codon:yes gene_type:complete
MINKRKEEERQERKIRILKGALSVFRDVGIEKTTMDEIASVSGFGKATLYYYFSSKDDVYIDIMEQGWKQLWEGIESRIVEDVGPRNKFIGIIKKMGKIVTEDKVMYEFLFTAPNYIQDTHKQTWKTYQERLYAILQSIIEDGIKKKEFVDLNPGLLMKAIGGLFHQLLISGDDDLNDDEFEEMLRNFLKPKV